MHAAESGLKPAEFWELQYWEFVLWMEGQKRKARAQKELTAWAVAHLMNVHSPKSRVTVDKLLGRRGKPRDDNEVTEASIRERGEKARLKHAEWIERNVK